MDDLYGTRLDSLPCDLLRHLIANDNVLTSRPKGPIPHQSQQGFNPFYSPYTNRSGDFREQVLNPIDQLRPSNLRHYRSHNRNKRWVSFGHNDISRL
jgi:hypothetical protein